MGDTDHQERPRQGKAEGGNETRRLQKAAAAGKRDHCFNESNRMSNLFRSSPKNQSQRKGNSGCAVTKGLRQIAQDVWKKYGQSSSAKEVDGWKLPPIDILDDISEIDGDRRIMYSGQEE
jgi:hypothetical protein